MLYIRIYRNIFLEFMKGKYLFIVALLSLFKSVHAYHKLDSLNPNNNATMNSILTDSLTIDTNYVEVRKIDSIAELPYIDSSFLDTIKTDSIEVDSISFDEIITDTLIISDTLAFFLGDSIEFSKYYLLKSFFYDSTIQSNDTLKRLISNLVNYINYDEIVYTTNTLTSLYHDTLFLMVTDSAGILDSLFAVKRENILQAMGILLNQLHQDSTKVTIFNNYNDSLTFWLKNNQYGSFRFRLYDDNKEVVGLKVIPENKSTIQLALEPGTFVEKIRRKDRKETYIPITIKESKPIPINKQKIDIAEWDFEGNAALSFNQLHVSDEWAKGGESSISSLSTLKFSADYSHNKEKWDNDIEIKLGALSLLDDKESSSRFRKTEDKFEINSKYGRSAFNNYYYTALVNLKSQFIKGFDYKKSDSIPVSKFFSPGYFIFSLGMDYKPNKKFTLMVSPVTSKFTFVLDDSLATNDFKRFGLIEGEKVKKEIGAYMKSTWKYDFNKDIKLENKFNVFTNYIKNPEKKDEKRKLKEFFDMDWEINLSMKISEYAEATINTHLIYDYDIQFPKLDPDGNETGETYDKVQFKEYFSIGFTYKFKR